MRLPRHILVPTDFSQSADAALDYAVSLAAKLDAKIHVLNVIGTRALGGELGAMLTSGMLEDLFEANRKGLERLVTERAGKCAFAPVELETGDARTEILQAIPRLAIDLVVMGTHGRRGFSRVLLGSVAEAVARVAPCPVLLVRQGAS